MHPATDMPPPSARNLFVAEGVLRTPRRRREPFPRQSRGAGASPGASLPVTRRVAVVVEHEDTPRPVSAMFGLGRSLGDSIENRFQLMEVCGKTYNSLLVDR